MFGCFERSGNAREILDLAPACLRIQPFDIAPLALFDRSADIYFQEVLLPDNRCRHFPQIVIRADKSRYRDNSRIDKKFAYFGDTADILYPVFSRKAEIVVDPAADIVAVQDAAQQTALVQLALKRYRHRALPGTAQPGKPHHHTALLQQTLLILPRHHPIENRIDVILFIFHCQ